MGYDWAFLFQNRRDMQSINVSPAVAVADNVENIAGERSEVMEPQDRTHKSTDDSLKTGLWLRFIPYREAVVNARFGIRRKHQSGGLCNFWFLNPFKLLRVAFHQLRTIKTWNGIVIKRSWWRMNIRSMWKRMCLKIVNDDDVCFDRWDFKDTSSHDDSC